MSIDKRILNFLVIVILTLFTFLWTFFIFHIEFNLYTIFIVVSIRMVASLLILKDYSLSWSKSSQKTFLIKCIVYCVAFIVYAPLFYGHYSLAFLVSELFLFLLVINFLMYVYYFYVNELGIKKSKSIVIFGAGDAGLTLKSEFVKRPYKVKYFVDDNKNLQRRSIDGVKIVSQTKLKELMDKTKFDLLVIAMPSAPKRRTSEIYNHLHHLFYEIQTLPSLERILDNQKFSTQLKDISVEDLLSRNAKDLDKSAISSFIKNKTILVTGAGGSIGSEIVRQSINFKAKKIILIDHSEFNLYTLMEELNSENIEIIPIMSSILENNLTSIFEKYSIDILIHAAAYKHVHLVEENIQSTIRNNIVGTKRCIDLAIKYKIKKFILISTDKAVRPSSVMGATKRVCELYAQNVKSNETEIVAVRFGNVLGSSGSVIPKFKKQIQAGNNLTVTHPDITRYFMLVNEACELVLQAASIGKGGEIFILNMGEAVKIVDLAKKLIYLSGKKNIKIDFSGLRAGEKLYEELLIDYTNVNTAYDSITVAKPTYYDIKRLNSDISELLNNINSLNLLKKIVPEFDHKTNKK